MNRKARNTREKDRETACGPAALWISLIVLVVALTTWFSAQNGDQSAAVSVGIASSLPPVLSLPDDGAHLDFYNFLLRKGAHFLLYFILGCGLTGLAIRQRRFPAFLTAVLPGAAYAALDEFHQSFVPGRDARVVDILLDTCGVAAGCAVILLCFSLGLGFFRKNSGGEEGSP